MLGRDLPNSKFDPNVEPPTRTMDLFDYGGIAKGRVAAIREWSPKAIWGARTGFDSRTACGKMPAGVSH
jgi:hypothetical protein